MNCGTTFEKPSKPISSTARRRNLSDFTSYVTNCSGADETVKSVSGLGQGIFNHLLGRPVDLVTDKSLRPELRPFIELEAVYVGPGDVTIS